MTLEQLLALLRAAPTQEARAATYAGLTSAQRQQLNQATIARAEELAQLAARTPDQDAEMGFCLDAAEALDAIVRADVATTQRIQRLSANQQGRTPNPALVTVQPRSDATPPAPGEVPYDGAGQSRYVGGASTFQENPAIARAIAGDLYAYGLQDRQIDHLASREYIGEFITWMRSCSANPNGVQSRALNEVTIDGGAAVVPLDFVAEIIQRRADTKRVSSLVRRYQTSRDSLSIPKFLGGDSQKINDLAVQWVGAEGSVTEDTSLEAFGNVEIKMHRGGILIIADRAWLEDAAFDMEAWVVDQIVDMYEAMLDWIIINGSGVGRPFGLVTRTGNTTPAAGVYTCNNIGDPVDFAGLIAQQGSLSSQYAANAQYLWQRLALYTQVLGILSTTGQPVMGTANTTAGGTTARVDTQVLGYPATQSDAMAAVGAGNKVNYFGDFRAAYGLVERVTLQMEPYLDPAIQKKDQRGWYVRFRLGGDRLAEWALRCGLNTDL